MTREEVDEAMEHSKRARRLWANTPIHQRAEYFYRAADILLAHTQEIAAVLMKEILKDKASAISEVERSADFLRYTADIGKSLEGTAVSGENFPGGSRGKLSYVTHVPLGTVLAIAPFNYPVNLSMSKIAPALIGGNTVVLKPPSQGAISALYLAAVFAEAGLPAGVLNTVTGRGSEIGDYLVCHPDVNFINFTGSTEIGRHIAEIAGMVPMMLELGGKDAAIVLDDCDLDFAAQNVVAGAFFLFRSAVYGSEANFGAGACGRPLCAKSTGTNGTVDLRQSRRRGCDGCTVNQRTVGGICTRVD